MFQKQGESLTDYYHRVDLYRSKIIEKLSTEIKDGTLPGRIASTEETALSVFINGLFSEIGTMLRTRGFLNLTEAGRFAVEEDKIRSMNASRQLLFNHKPTKLSDTNRINYTKPNITHTPHKICNYCNNPEHLISECRKRAYNNSIRNNQPGIQRSLPAPTTQMRTPIQRALPAPSSAYRVNDLNYEATSEASSPLEIGSASCSTIQTPTPNLIRTLPNPIVKKLASPKRNLSRSYPNPVHQGHNPTALKEIIDASPVYR